MFLGSCCLEEVKVATCTVSSAHFVEAFMDFVCNECMLRHDTWELLFQRSVHRNLWDPIAACFRHCASLATSIVCMQSGDLSAVESCLPALAEIISTPFRYSKTSKMNMVFDSSSSWVLAVFSYPQKGQHVTRCELWKAQVELNAWFKRFHANALDIISTNEVVAHPSDLPELLKEIHAMCLSDAERAAMGNHPLVLKCTECSVEQKQQIANISKQLSASFARYTATKVRIEIAVLMA
jgi:hypothetical protein